MGKLCMYASYHSLHPIHFIGFMAHPCTFAIDHAEHGLEEPPEPAPAEAIDFEQDQGKPRCI
jgi:hypothetical protein